MDDGKKKGATMSTGGTTKQAPNTTGKAQSINSYYTPFGIAHVPLYKKKQKCTLKMEEH